MLLNSPAYTHSDTVLRFGPFAFHLQQRLVLEGDRPLRLGGRALDILQVLIEHAGSVVSKECIIARVWPRSVVEEINLRVHIAALRRALRDGQDGAYIVNIPQRGYSFTAPVEQASEPVAIAVCNAHGPQHNLPARLTSIVGRDAVVGNLLRLLPRQRLVTLVGPCGIGKSTVALRAGELLLGHFCDGVWWLDLAQIDDPEQEFDHLTRTLDLTPQALEQRHALLILDNCEHLLERCRTLVRELRTRAPRLSILVTSREPLLTLDETLLPLPPLLVPPLSALRSVDDVLGYSAVQLLVSRARARQQGFTLREQDLSTVRDICRRLDGLPLAIELAAAQIDALALVGVQAQLDNCFQLLTQGRRTAVPRHQTLKAALDWSYERLSPLEQCVLQRVAVFKSSFTLDAALGVVGGNSASLRDVLASLALKSLLSLDQTQGTNRYRFLNTTRRYALEKRDHPASDTPLWRGSLLPSGREAAP